MKPTEALKDAAILVALVLLATSVRVTELPRSPLPETHAGAPAAAPAETAIVAPPAVLLPADSRSPVAVEGTAGSQDLCPRLQRLTVNGPNDEQVVIEIDLEPGLRRALGLCGEPADSAPTRCDKA
jgi:hypothetical protein